MNKKKSLIIFTLIANAGCFGMNLQHSAVTFMQLALVADTASESPSDSEKNYLPGKNTQAWFVEESYKEALPDQLYQIEKPTQKEFMDMIDQGFHDKLIVLRNRMLEVIELNKQKPSPAIAGAWKMTRIHADTKNHILYVGLNNPLTQKEKLYLFKLDPEGPMYFHPTYPALCLHNLSPESVFSVSDNRQVLYTTDAQQTLRWPLPQDWLKGEISEDTFSTANALLTIEEQRIFNETVRLKVEEQFKEILAKTQQTAGYSLLTLLAARAQANINKINAHT